MASANQVLVDLKLRADNTDAKRAINELKSSMSTLNSSLANPSLGITKEVNEAVVASRNLKTALNSALNIDTNKIDLTKFRQSLANSGTSIQKLATQLYNVGPAGRDTFNKLTSAITQAEAPIKRNNTLLSNFANTMKNVAKYQLTTTIWRELTSVLSSAYNYAKDLDESLNNIQIVTGASSEAMAEFAERANKAAISLSTTTTKYTDAALIFYQQGIRDADQIEERTNAVIKMANVTKDSVTTVSSYMTAIWNNFDDGTESLEHYADVITALGATTASSSAEIAAGIEKFASIGKTVGLSYDYATSALATVVANTRQSADTVGTAFKTIFSRLQGLSLGESLEDGVDLNKYSKALNAVGVQVLDTSGQLKDLDVILDDLADKWGTLTSAQQTALAQTVAGTRQYTQLMALMNNWSDMETNLETASGSEGTLDEQADIYADSWEAAETRVKAAAQSIYSDLIDEDFFINIANGFEKILTFVDKLIDSVGGLQPLLAGVSAIVLKLFSSQISNGLSSMVLGFENITGITQKRNESFKTQAINAAQLANTNANGKDPTTVSEDRRLQVMNEQKEIQRQINALKSSGKNFSEEELNSILQENKAYNDQYLQLTKIWEKENKDLGNNEQIIKGSNSYARTKSPDKQYLDFGDTTSTEGKATHDLIGEIQKLSASEGNLATVTEKKKTLVDILINKYGVQKNEAEAYANSLQKEAKAHKASGDAAEGHAKQLENTQNQIENLASNQTISQTFTNMTQGATSVAFGIQQISSAFTTLSSESATASQKAMALMTMMSMAIPSVITGTKNLVVNYGVLGKKLAENAAYEELLASARKLNIDVARTYTSAILQQNSAMTAEELAAEMHISTTTAQNIIDKVHAGVAIEDAVAQELNTLQEEQNTAAKVANTAATVGNYIAQKILGHTLETNVAILLGMSVVLATVAAVTVGLVAGIKAASDAYNADAKAAEKAATAAKNLKTAASDAKTTLTSLSDAIDNYDTLIDTLDSCTKGTEEWSDALEDVQTKTAELLETYPQLLKYTGQLYNDDGTISDEALSWAKKEAKTDSLESQARYLMAQGQSDVASATSQVTNAIRSDDISATNAALIGGGAGAGAGTIAGPIGIAIGAAIGAAGGAATAGLSNLTENKEEREAYDKLIAAYNTEGAEALSLANVCKTLGHRTTNLSDETLDYVTKIQQAAQAQVDAAESIKKAADSVVQAWESSTGTDMTDSQEGLAGSAYQGKYEEYYEEYLKKTKDGINKWSGKNDQQVKELWSEYMTALGKDYKLASNAVVGNDNNRSFQYIKDGQTETVSAEEVAETIAATKALSDLGASAEKASSAILSIKSNIEDSGISDTIINWFSEDDFDSASGQDFEKLYEEAINLNGGSNNFSQWTGETDEDYESRLIKMFSEITGLEIEEIEELNIDTKEFFSDLTNEEEARKKLWDESKASAQGWNITTVKAGKDAGLDQKNLSTWETRDALDIIQEGYKYGGSKTQKAVSDIFANTSEDKIGDLEEAWESDIDFTSVETLTEDLEELGIVVDGIDLQSIVDAYQGTNTHTLEEAATQYKNVNDVLKDVKEVGDTISSTDYAKLGSDASKYFEMTADGTYALKDAGQAFFDWAEEEKSKYYTETRDYDEKELDKTEKTKNFLETASDTYGTDDTHTWKYLNTKTSDFEANSQSQANAAAMQQDFLTQVLDMNWMDAATATMDGSAVEMIQEYIGAYDDLDSAVEGANEKIESYQDEIDQTNVLILEGSSTMAKYDEYVSTGTYSLDEQAEALKYLTSKNKNCTKEYNNLVAAQRKVSKYTAEEIKVIGSEANKAYQEYAAAVTAANKALKANEFKNAASDIKDVVAAMKAATTEEEKLSYANQISNTLYADTGILIDPEVIKKHQQEFDDFCSGEESSWQDTIEWMSQYSKDAIYWDPTELENTIASFDGKIEVEDNSEVVLGDYKFMCSSISEFFKDPYIIKCMSEGNFDEILNGLSQITTDGTTVASLLHSIGLTDITLDASNLTAYLTYLADIMKSAEEGNMDRVESLKDNLTKAANFRAVGTVPDYPADVDDVGSGGGGSSSGTTKSDEIGRYVKVEDQAEVYAEDLTDLQRAMDHISGDSLISNLEKQSEAYENTKNNLKDYLAEIQTYLDTDLTAAQDALTKAGFTGEDYTISYNAETGKVENKEAILNAVYDTFAARGTKDDEGKDVFKEADQTLWNIISDAFDQLDETADLYITKNNEYEEAVWSQLDLQEKIMDASIEDFETVQENYLADQEKLYNKTLKRQETTSNRSYGANQIAALQDLAKTNKNLADLTQKQMTNAETYFNKVLTNFNTQFKSDGFELKVDDDNNLTNYSELLAKAQDMKENGKTEAEQALGETLVTYLKKVLDASDDLTELEQDYEDYMDEYYEKNYEALTTAVENQIDVIEAEADIMDAYVSMLGDSVYKAAEIFKEYNDELANSKQQGSVYEDAYTKATAAYKAGEITQEQYIEDVKDLRDNLIDVANDIISKDQEMFEYYGETLDDASNELKTFSDELSNINKIFGHLDNLIKLTGGSTNYSLRKTVLQGASKNAQDTLSTSVNTYNMYSKEKDNLAKSIKDNLGITPEELMGLDPNTLTKEQEMFRNNWQEIVSTAQEAEDQMYTDAESAANAIQAVFDLSLEEAADNLEKSLTEGLGWDAINDTMSNASTIADEYLTKTNQIYETDKLIRSINQDIDKTDNAAAKKKYAAFEKEIEQLQEKDKLSNLELNIAKAKYEVLQAQIALEEAQNNKSTVKLSRDSEGNYGYVYTADQDAVDDAEQNLADKENDLYNIRLEATNNYGQKVVQAYQDCQDKLTALDEEYQSAGKERDEAYYTRRQQIVDDYTEQLETYSELYSIAQEEDARVVQDAWVNSYSNIINQGSNFKTSITGYIAEIDRAWDNWETDMDGITKQVGLDEDSVTKKTKDLNTESTNLANTVNTVVIPALSDEISSVDTLTSSYASLRDNLLATASAYLQLASAMNAAVSAANNTKTTTTTTIKAASASSTTYTDTNFSGLAVYLAQQGYTATEINNALGADYTKKKASTSGSGYTTYTNLGNAAVTIANSNPSLLNTASAAVLDYVNGTDEYDWAEEAKKFGFASGGYTGAWGEQGKLAILHEKELVLNSDDTENMLSIVSMVRDIASNITLSAGYGLTALSSSGINSTDNTLQQNVNITAEFPNATDHSEIEEAFNNLINQATQYANRY